jgi:hypothetical protein
MAEPSDRDLLWNNYKVHIDLYKFYIDATIKVNVFVYAITGAILSFFFTKVEDVPLVKWSLVLPIVLNLGLACLCIYGANRLEITRRDVFRIRDLLGLVVAPEMKVLGVLLWIFAVAEILTAVGMIVALCKF